LAEGVAALAEAVSSCVHFLPRLPDDFHAALSPASDPHASYSVSEPASSLMELCLLARMRAVRVSVGGLNSPLDLGGLLRAMHALAQGLQSVSRRVPPSPQREEPGIASDLSLCVED
jgi:hypothetical protein